MTTTHIDNTATFPKHQDTLLDEARCATQSEHELTFLRALRLYPKAIAWSMFLSLAIIMEGYDMKLVGSLFAQPAFQGKYGQQLPDGTYEISASWQAGLSNGASIGSLVGLLINGYLSERFGFRQTMLASLALITATIFIPFFAPSIEVLQVGQVLMGIPWGIFQTLTTSYAAEVTPTHLRAYLTTYVNLCWVFGQLLSAGVLRGVLTRSDQWSYRIPFALQWVWPIPLMIGIIFAPESPWWLVRKNRLEEAKAALRRLTSPGRIEFDADQAITLMVVTTESERETGTGTRYIDCFRAVDLRRTSIACCCWGIQILSGTGLRIYSTYFYQQAGLPTEQAFTMSIIQYALGIAGVFVAWILLPRFGRRTIYLWGLGILAVVLLVIGGLGVADSRSPSPADSSASSGLAWSIGSMLIVYTFFYDVTIGPVCYSLVAEIPSVRLRSKSIVLARITYNILNIVSNIITPYMLNPSAWNWGAKAGFFYGGTCVLSFVYTYFCIPEPSGRTYAERIGMSGMKEEARQGAQAMTLMSGLRGPALEFAHTLSRKIQDSFELFSQKLIDQFPFEKKVVNKFDMWMQAGSQKQGNRSFEEYAESVRLLSSQVGPENQSELAQAWVAGLNNQFISAAVRTTMLAWDEITIPKTVAFIRQALGNQASDYATPPRTESEKVAAALSDLTETMKGALITPGRTGPSTKPRFEEPSQMGRAPGLIQVPQQRGPPKPLETMVCSRCGQSGHITSPPLVRILLCPRRNRIDIIGAPYVARTPFFNSSTAKNTSTTSSLPLIKSPKAIKTPYIQS